MVEEQYTINELVNWIVMYLDSFKIKRASRQLNINNIEFNIDKSDLLNNELVEIMLNEFEELRRAIHERMQAESELPENRMYGMYIPGDVWIEALIDLNALIDEIETLLRYLS